MEDKNLERNLKILKELETKSQKEVGKIFGLTQSAVGRIARKYGFKAPKSRVNMSKIPINVNYFEKIDSPKKAYWLGWICADGSINKVNGKMTFCIKDLEVLEKFVKDIESEHKIAEWSYLDKRTNNIYYEYSLQITNAIFVQHIVDKGVTNQKSEKLEFPKIDPGLYSYFIAGLFDGDGSVYIRNINNRQQIGCNLISTKEVLEFIQDLFETLGIKRTVLQKVSENTTNVWKAYWYKDTKKVLNYIYQGNSNIYLSRKYQKYQECLNISPSRNRIQQVLQYDLNGTFIQKFDSLKTAAESLNTCNSTICDGCKTKRQRKGYFWVYFNDGDEIFKIRKINNGTIE